MPTLVASNDPSLRHYPDRPPVLTEEQRRSIFLELVTLQDGGLSVDASRVKVLHRFDVGLRQVREIESEGMAKDWPPLGPDA